ncbi:MAG: VOC family protein [Bacteroidales bacterium]|nr:VOC family protein [Bacteroidales bacterium]
MLNLEKVHHVAVICSDYGRSLRFYTEVLGFTVIAEHYRAERDSYKTDLALGEEFVIELFSFPSPPPRPTRPEAAGLRHLAFGVRDLEKEAARLESSGIVHEPIRTDPFTGKKFLFFFDPDDLPLELYEL